MKLSYLFILVSPIVFAQPQPHITAIVSSANFGYGIAASGYATIFGTNLSGTVAAATGTPYPTTLAKAQVQFCPGGIGAGPECELSGIVFASPTQINFLVPTDITEYEAVRVNVNGVLDDGWLLHNGGQTLRDHNPNPRIFFEAYDCLIDERFANANENCGLTELRSATLLQATRGAITDDTGRVLTSSNRAHFGRYYSIWLTGLGNFTDGQPNNAVSMAFTNVPRYSSGGVLLPGDGPPEAISLAYVGVSSQFPGLNQINFRLEPPANSDGPPNAFPCGALDWELSVSIVQAGIPANLVQIPVDIERGDLPCGG